MYRVRRIVGIAGRTRYVGPSDDARNRQRRAGDQTIVSIVERVNKLRFFRRAVSLCNLVLDLADPALAQRAYEFNTRAVRTADNMLSATTERLRPACFAA